MEQSEKSLKRVLENEDGLKGRQFVNEVTKSLEQGVKDVFESGQYQEYLNTMSKFHRYSISNLFLIAAQRPDATRVAGYNSWNKNFKRQVKKGEKGIKILAPTPYKVKHDLPVMDPKSGEQKIDVNGNPVTKTVEVECPFFKFVNVFDVSQTEGEELPNIATELKGNVDEYSTFLDALKKVSPVPVGFEKISGSSHGYYHFAEKRIAVKEGMSEAQTVKTLIHEIAHSKLHDPDHLKSDSKWKIVMVSDGGLKIDYRAGFESEADAVAVAEDADWTFVDENQFKWCLEVEEDLSAVQAQEKDSHTKEVEAESVAYVVCQKYGIDSSDYSFGYVAGWSSGKETKELKASLETIRKTASEIIQDLDKELERDLPNKESVQNKDSKTHEAEEPKAKKKKNREDCER